MESCDQFSSILSYFQPAVAWFGLVGCLSVVLVFNSAIWWNGDVSVQKVAVAYIAVSCGLDLVETERWRMLT